MTVSRPVASQVVRTVCKTVLALELAQTLSQALLDISYREQLYAFGDSITAGSNASTTSNRFTNQFAQTNYLTLTNKGVASIGVWNQCKEANALSVTKSNTIWTWMAGLNDIRRGSSGDRATTRKKIEACVKSVVLSAIGDVFTSSGAAGVTKTGLTSSYTANAVGGKYSNATITTNSGDAVTWEWTFTGTQFGVQIMGSGAAFNYGTAHVYIDDVLIESIDMSVWYDDISDGSYDNQRGPVGLSYHGLSSGSHTVKVVSGGDGHVAVDYFCTLKSSAADCVSLMLMEIPYLNSTGYATVGYNNANTTVSDQASAVVESISTTYRGLGFPVVYCPTNDYYDITTGLDTDNIHPNDTGMDQIESALNACISRATEISDGWTLTKAVAGDLSGTIYTVTGINSSNQVTGTNPGSNFGALWLATGSNNAAEWTASGTGVSYWILFGDGTTGFSGCGDYSSTQKPPTSTGRFNNSTGALTSGSAISASTFGSATKYRASRIGNVIRFEAYVPGTGWVRSINDVNISSVFTSGHFETVKIGLLMSTSSITAANVRIGTKV